MTEDHSRSSGRVIEPESSTNSGDVMTIALTYSNLLLGIVAAQEMEQLCRGQHRVVIRDDQPFPASGIVVLPEVPQDGLSLATVTLKLARVSLRSDFIVL